MNKRPTSAAVSPLTPVVISEDGLSGSTDNEDFNWQEAKAADGHILPEIAWWRGSGSTAFDRAEVARLHLCAVAQANREFLAGGAA
jgi:hypothetical protein